MRNKTIEETMNNFAEVDLTQTNNSKKHSMWFLLKIFVNCTKNKIFQEQSETRQWV